MRFRILKLDTQGENALEISTVLVAFSLSTIYSADGLPGSGRLVSAKPIVDASAVRARPELSNRGALFYSAAFLGKKPFASRSAIMRIST